MRRWADAVNTGTRSPFRSSQITTPSLERVHTAIPTPAIPTPVIPTRVIPTPAIPTPVLAVHFSKIHALQHFIYKQSTDQ